MQNTTAFLFPFVVPLCTDTLFCWILCSGWET